MSTRILVRTVFHAAGALVLFRFVLAALGGSVPVATAWATKLLLDGLSGAAGPSAPSVGALVVWVAVAGALGGVVPSVSQYVDSEISRRLARRMQNELFASLAGMHGLAVLERPKLRDQLHVAQQAAQQVPFQAVVGIQSAVQSTVMISGFLATLLHVGWIVTALVVASAVPTLVGQIFVSRRRAAMLFRTASRWRRQLFYTLLLSDVRALKEIRLFGCGEFLRSRMDSEMQRGQQEERTLDRVTGVVEFCLSLLTAAMAGLALFFGVKAVVTGEENVGSLVVLTSAIVGVQGGLAAVVRQAASIYQALKVFHSYTSIVAAPQDVPEPAAPVKLPRLRDGIEVRDVWFRYGEEHPWVLRGVSFTIRAGATTALVGLNGSGKSTLVKLLCRLYDPGSGVVAWDGIDIRRCRPSDLRRCMSAIFQDYMTYELSAAENIGLGDVKRLGSTDLIRGAARNAEIDSVLERLPRGYDTILSRAFATDTDDASADGVLLSGGQWQRVALARALLRDEADVLILDEPTTALDPEVDEKLRRQMRRWRKGRTMLVISHRLNAVRDADHIVVLASGRVVEQGTHDELLAIDGEYARLFRMQAMGYREQFADGAVR